MIHKAVWKYDRLYKLLENDSRFLPQIVVCPYTQLEFNYMISEMDDIYNHFKNKGYNVVNSYHDEVAKWIDIKKEVKPDIIFFTNPHNLTKAEYYIHNFRDYITCYVPYAFVVIGLTRMHYGQRFHSLLWKYFLETDEHLSIYKSFQDFDYGNAKVTGYPALDSFFDKEYVPKAVWKKNSSVEYPAKKIIWAPHHSIADKEGSLMYSTFLDYYDYFQKFAEQNRHIQIAFKPHPILKNALYQRSDWGKERTDEYYNYWAINPNTQLEESDYVDLFIESNALIHDSASFMAEYMCTGHPVLFLKRSDDIRDRINSFGQKLYDLHYHSSSESEITEFIQDVILKGNDNRKSERDLFVEKTLKPSNGKLATINIYEELEKQFKGVV
ncbi:CDP-glycerol glycerophosphotransferase family protein [uncultured Marivirga sp.]|uniref:CDP-glycerol glycerophosphotransferase family protein n=1 Tax=uncultured Marivirga sp. TaxID=1123707 RepID=UPI0030EE5CE5